jgi:hypothetical protein
VTRDPWQPFEHRIEIIYLRISSPHLALRRIAARVKQAGTTYRERMSFGDSSNFEKYYRLLADAWSVYDNSARKAKLLERSPMKQKPIRRVQTSKEFSDAVGRALRRAARMARKTARMHGTPIYIWKDGKVVAEKP